MSSSTATYRTTGGPNDEAARLADLIADAARERGCTVAVAESLTSGTIACRLGAAPDASSWFAGGVIAYASEVKFKVLDVARGPVVTARCAVQMARGAALLLGADLVVAVTGVGGPEPDEGHPAGTVYLAVVRGPDEDVVHYRFDGGPTAVVEAATVAALRMLSAALHGE
ncbi:CinA family protein [Kribbella capetownensis]|uniref:CinA family protein n=1 Tax=Kribbella capetownensis TaxID=1572659 RepID=A0A4R0K2N7_9ACTN|nr:CinA family protein [Kribbella capetownensis]TCC49105.1 CinA family protein [Kribbella capetownensis]